MLRDGSRPLRRYADAEAITNGVAGGVGVEVADSEWDLQTYPQRTDQIAGETRSPTCRIATDTVDAMVRRAFGVSIAVRSIVEQLRASALAITRTEEALVVGIIA